MLMNSIFSTYFITFLLLSNIGLVVHSANITSNVQSANIANTIRFTSASYRLGIRVMNKSVNFKCCKLKDTIRAMLNYFRSNVTANSLYLSETAMK